MWWWYKHGSFLTSPENLIPMNRPCSAFPASGTSFGFSSFSFYKHPCLALLEKMLLWWTLAPSCLNYIVSHSFWSHLLSLSLSDLAALSVLVQGAQNFSLWFNVQHAPLPLHSAIWQHAGASSAWGPHSLALNTLEVQAFFKLLVAEDMVQQWLATSVLI